MKNLSTLAFVAALALGSGCNRGASASGNATPKTDEQKTLYALGETIGGSLSAFDLSQDELKYVYAGMADSVSGAKPQVDAMEYRGKIQELMRTRRPQVEKKRQAEAEKEKEKGKAAVASAEKEAGAVKLPGGEVYVPEKEGTGASPAATDRVKVNYEGKLLDGTVFDSSYKRGEPAQFPLRGVIPCWTDGLQKMKVGGKAKLVCPSDTAYGDRGRPPTIPGGATLVFTVELLEIEAPPPPPAMPTAPTVPAPHAAPTPPPAKK